MKNFFMRLLFLVASLGLVMLLIGGVRIYMEDHRPASISTVPDAPEHTSLDPKNGTYLVEGTMVTLKDGLSEVATVPGSASQTITRYFGNNAMGDLDGDAEDDTVFLLTQQSGGSGTFYYVSALLSRGGAKGTNAIMLGDRIAPQSTEIRGGKIVVNYGDRKEGDPMTALPSLGVTKYFVVASGTLAEEKKQGTPGEKATNPTKPAGKISGKQWAKETCVAQSGNWDEKYSECTGISESLCSTIGGEWNGCASACRHDPTAQMCTMQCVLICTIE